MPFYSQLRKRRADDRAWQLRAIDRLESLRKGLAKHMSDNSQGVDRDKTVRVMTWNIREFGGSKYGGRDHEPLYYIAEIISHFDIVALQEVRDNLKELYRLMRILGPDWDHLATDVTEGSAGNKERMVFLFNQRKAYFTNIAGELTLPSGKKVLAAFGERITLGGGVKLVLPQAQDLSGDYPARTKTTRSGKIKLDRDLEIRLPQGSILELPDECALAVPKNTVIERPKKGVARVSIPTPTIASKGFKLRFPGRVLDDSFKQFARTPYLVSFQSGWLKLNLCTVHIYFGDNEDPALLAQRRREIAALTEALGDRAQRELAADPEHKTFLGVLGDFNIISQSHETMAALESNGFVVPNELKRIPGTNVAKDKAYDQIAFWKPDADRGYARLDILGAGVFDFFKHVYRTTHQDQYDDAKGRGTAKFKTWRTYKMSDHLPMWVELRNDFSAEYLEHCRLEDD